jgi:hypothetical protein
LDSRWALQKGLRKAAGKYPKAIGKPLDKVLKDIESRWEMLKYTPSANRRGGSFAQRLSAKTWQLQFISCEVLHFSLLQ